MPTLTRRRSNDPHRKVWNVYYGDVRVGHIGQRAGVPVDVEQWGWSCGFYPGLHPGQHANGAAEDFETARADFEAAWARLLPALSATAFEEYRHDRTWRAEVAAKRARGEKLDSEIPSSMMRCVCGVRFDSHKPDESGMHRQHIYAAQAEGRA
jgi:hypothetical protein